MCFDAIIISDKYSILPLNVHAFDELLHQVRTSVLIFKRPEMEDGGALYMVEFLRQIWEHAISYASGRTFRAESVEELVDAAEHITRHAAFELFIRDNGDFAVAFMKALSDRCEDLAAREQGTINEVDPALQYFDHYGLHWNAFSQDFS